MNKLPEDPYPTWLATGTILSARCQPTRPGSTPPSWYPCWTIKHSIQILKKVSITNTILIYAGARASTIFNQLRIPAKKIPILSTRTFSAQELAQKYVVFSTLKCFGFGWIRVFVADLDFKNPDLCVFCFNLLWKYQYQRKLIGRYKSLIFV